MTLVEKSREYAFALMSGGASSARLAALRYVWKALGDDSHVLGIVVERLLWAMVEASLALVVEG